MKYSEFLGSRVPAFVRAVWELIGTSTPAVREDTMISQAIKFLSVTAKTGVYTALFGQQATLEGLAEQIIVPSMPLRGWFRVRGIGVACTEISRRARGRTVRR